jgi:threonyl-tRNA synthetase
VAYLIELSKGTFPTWHGPINVNVIPVSNEVHSEYAWEVCNALKDKGIRVEVDDRNEKMGYKIRQSQTKKIPYQLVVGDKEIEGKTVTVRCYGSKEIHTKQFEKFVKDILEDVANFSREDD